MKVRYEVAQFKDETLLSEKDFFAKIDKSIANAEKGKTKILTTDQQKVFLGL